MALSVVLLFRATGLANFAQGQMAGVGLFIFLQISVLDHHSYLVGILAALAATLVLGCLLGLLAPRMERVGGPVVPLVSSFGLLLALQAALETRWGAREPYIMPAPLGRAMINFGSFSLPRNYLTALVVGLIAAMALAILFRVSKVGLQLRASVDNSEASELLGVPTWRLRLLAWLLATALALIAAYPYVSIVNLETDATNQLLLKGFAAATLGRFQSFTASLVGGIGLGVLESFLSRYASGSFADLLAIGIVVSTLFVMPGGLFALRTARQ
jgi:branched-chain amino acid transport system permease protein